MPLSLRALTAPEFVATAPSLVDIHLSAMRYPARLRESRIAAWKQDSTMPGFLAFCAFSTPPPPSPQTPPGASRAPSPGGASQSANGILAGIAYGFRGSPDTWWHHNVRRGLLYRREPASVLNDYFEVAEVHVAPAHQGRGVGRALLTRLLEHVSEPEALLSTPEVPGEDNRAFRLYRSFGFRDVLRSFYFPGDSRPFAVLGASLPLVFSSPPPPPPQESPTG